MSERGKMVKFYEITCYDCGISQILTDGLTAKEATAEARQEYDWSLGRDKRWRCTACRTARWGESANA